jgi:hypothetical protein
MVSGKRFRPDHYKFVDAFKDMVGQTLKTSQIEQIMFDKFKIIPGSVRPNDHGDGNMGDCPCTHTEDKIFDKIKHGYFKVRPNVK